MLKCGKTKLKTQSNKILLSEFASDDELRVARIFHNGKHFQVELWDLQKNTLEKIDTKFEDSAEYEADLFVTRHNRHPF